MTARPTILLPVLSVVSASLFFALMQGLALRETGGVFEYPLDDPYIHLAMAENIARGGYGINLGEYASASSSALFPLLLWPVGPEGLQRLQPLFWNIVGMTIAAWLWGRLLGAAGYGEGRLRPIGIAAGIAGPLAVLMVSASLTGMEHSLHAAASLAILLGLLRFLQEGRPSVVLFAGIALAPLLRFEGLALALMAALVLYAGGARKPAVWAVPLAVVPIAGFSLFLISLGLDPLPNSVQAKLVGPGEEHIGFVSRVIGTLRINLEKPGGALLAALIVAIVLLTRLNPALRASKSQLFALALVGAGTAHLLFGQIGWLDRYEHYILAVLTGGFLVLLAQARLAPGWSAALATAVLVTPSAIYFPKADLLPISAGTIRAQQQQMARFAKDFADVPVAVNDLGWVAWRNPNYVLDLWGLASAEARNARLFAPEKGWAEPLAKRRSVQLAMIYDEWLADATGPDWVRLGALRLNERKGYLGSDIVAFYATSPEYVPLLRTALHEWVPTLEPTTYFTYAEGIE